MKIQQQSILINKKSTNKFLNIQFGIQFKINFLQINQKVFILNNLIFLVIKMQYQRLPLSHKQNEYIAKKSPTKSYTRKQDTSHRQQQNKNQRESILLEKAYLNNLQNQKTPLSRNTKHIKSQMVFDNELDLPKSHIFNNINSTNYQLNSMNSTSLNNLNINPYEGQNVGLGRPKYEEDRKYNVKHMQIQSKINKIQSYHQKIQHLLDIVNTTKSKTPSKVTQRHQQILPSRSLTKLNTPSAKQSILREKSRRRQRPLYEVLQRKKTNDAKQFEQYTNIQYHKNSQYNVSKVVQERKNRYTRDDKVLQQSNRKKSKQIMKSYQGQVRDIQQTIQKLNKKIKQNNEGLSFRKQVNFDNLSTTSNPESTFELNKQKQERQIMHDINNRTNFRQNSNNLLKSPSSYKKTCQVDSLSRYQASGKYVNPYQASIQTSQQRRVSQYERYKMRKGERKQIYQSPQKSYEKTGHKQLYQGSNKKTGVIYKYDKQTF